MRLASVTGDVLTLLNDNYENVEDLRKTMRARPQDFPGEYNLLGSKYVLSIQKAERFTIVEREL